MSVITAQATEVDLDSNDNIEIDTCWKAWNGLCGTRPLPRWSEDFDWFAFPVHLLPYFVVVDVIDDGDDFRYRFWGTAHTDIFRQDYTGKRVSEIKPAVVSVELRQQYRRVRDTAAPCLFTLDVIDDTHFSLPVREISLRLPFVSEDGTISRIVSFSDNRRQSHDFKEFFAALPNGR